MNLLLDTHVLVWFDSDASQISRAALAAIHDPSNKLFFSTASTWELAIKASLSRTIMTRPVWELVDVQLQNRFTELPIWSRHALAIENLPHHHRDPFDRIIVAQALVEEATLVSKDSILKSYPIRVLW